MVIAGMFVVRLLLLALVAASVHAEERFYQIMDASGRVQVIRQPSASTERDAKFSEAPQKQKLVPANSESTGKPTEVYAPYDGESYIDSDAMDAAHESGLDASRRRFYVISDGVGQRLQSMEGPAYPTGAEQVPAEVSSYIALRDTYAELSPSVIKGLVDGCLGSRLLDQAQPLDAEAIRDVIFDRRLHGYVKENEVVQVYALAGSGLRGVTIRSHASKDKEPGFVMPLVAFADKNGCVTRIGEGYFQRYRASNTVRHAMVEGSLVVRSDDAYMFFIMPDAVRQSLAIRPEFRVTSLGRVSIKWQK